MRTGLHCNSARIILVGCLVRKLCGLTMPPWQQSFDWTACECEARILDPCTIAECTETPTWSITVLSARAWTRAYLRVLQAFNSYSLTRHDEAHIVPELRGWITENDRPPLRCQFRRPSRNMSTHRTPIKEFECVTPSFQQRERHRSPDLYIPTPLASSSSVRFLYSPGAQPSLPSQRGSVLGLTPS